MPRSFSIDVEVAPKTELEEGEVIEDVGEIASPSTRVCRPFGLLLIAAGFTTQFASVWVVFISTRVDQSQITREAGVK